MQNPEKQKWSVWLMPVPSESELWKSRIANIANQLGSPLFEPHITVYSGSFLPGLDPAFLLSALRPEWEMAPLQLMPLEVSFSSRPDRSIVYTFPLHPKLESAYHHLARLADPDEPAFTFEPHMSMAYGRISFKKKSHAVAMAEDWLGPITFGRWAVVDTSLSRVANLAVDTWKMLI